MNWLRNILKLIRRSFKPAGLLIAVVFLFSCGIEEYYYLPQVPETNITRTANTEAEISIPSISEDRFYYALNYSIFYRIYISGQLISGGISESDMGNINPSLANDFYAIFPSTDPTNTTSSTSVNNLFRNRNYFKLEFDGADIDKILSTTGGRLRIRFPTAAWDFPVASFNNGHDFRLNRSSERNNPEPDIYFRNTSELNSNINTASNTNIDVTGRSGLSQRYAYVSMYIVAVGLDPVAFTPIYSKPTHISVFKLPDTN